MPAQPLAQPQRDVIAEIEGLAQLRANGSLSEAEFEVMKAQALSQARGA
ncbi:SHOCT domain-containing protein [Methylobacterium sp. Leaf85]|nr:SHOCT domain-containing protein [Methylobacterium sp. Leaf85]